MGDRGVIQLDFPPFPFESCFDYHVPEAFKCLQFIIKVFLLQATGLLPASTAQQDSSVYEEGMTPNSLVFQMQVE